jgi:hypothetical protein
MVTIKNTIVGGNASNFGVNCDNSSPGMITNNGFNISDDASCEFGTSTGANGKQIGDKVDPMLIGKYF